MQKKGKAKEARKGKAAQSAKDSSEPTEDQENVGNNAAANVEPQKDPCKGQISHQSLSR